jgi:hypothetical protein
VATRVDPFLRAVLVAWVAHAVGLATALWSAGSAEGPAPAAAPQAAVAELIDIDLPSAETVSESSAESDVMIARRVAAPHPRSRSASRRGAGLTGSATEAAARAGSAKEAVVEAPSLSLEQLGIEGPNRLSLRTLEEEPLAAPERVPSTARVVQSLRQLAQEHDSKLGLGAGGPVATALEKAAYQSNVTLDGQATFKAVVIGDVVSAISLVPSGTEKQSAWNEVAKTALAQLAGRRVRVPRGSRAVVLHIQVVSRAALPSGHGPGIEITVGPFVVQRGSGKRSARLAFLDSVRLTSAVDLLGTSVPFSAPGAVVNLVRSDIDPVDLGAKDRHVVHTSTLDETPLD